MADVSDEVRAFFTSDTTGLRTGVKQAGALLDENARKEKYVADYIRNERRKTERENVLAPIRAKENAQKAAKAQIDAARETTERIERQRQASTFGNIRKELNANFGSNARQKVGAFIQNNTGLSQDASEGLVTRFGKFATVLGVAGVAAGAAKYAFDKLAEGAEEAKARMDSFSASSTDVTNRNTHTTAAEGVGSLSGRLPGLREADKQVRERDAELHPDTLAGQAQLRAQYFKNYGVNGNERLDIDRMKVDSNRVLIGEDIVRIQNQITQAARIELQLTGQKLLGNRQDLEISNLELARQTELNSLKEGSIATDENVKNVNSRYNAQIDAQKELRSAMAGRFLLESQINALQNVGLNSGQQQYETARLQNAELEEELQNRKYLTVEEQRSLFLQRQQTQNVVQQMQLQAVMRSPAQQVREQRAQQIRERRIEQANDRLKRTDGLRSIDRDASGNIIGGIDIITGRRRGVSVGFQQPRQGLSASGDVDSTGNSGLGIDRRSGGNDDPNKYAPDAFGPKDYKGKDDSGPGGVIADIATKQLTELKNQSATLTSIQASLMGLALSS